MVDIAITEFTGLKHNIQVDVVGWYWLKAVNTDC